MASKASAAAAAATATISNTASSFLRRSSPRPQYSFTCASRLPPRCRHFSSTPSALQEEEEAIETEAADRPRWQYTPPAMKMPFRAREMPKRSTRFDVNSDPQRLDEVYIRLLGQGGEKLLTEETKWLAVTHKSFDQGRRGFNDRLAYLGRRIINLQASLALLSAPRAPSRESGPDEYGREPFQHEALASLSNLSSQTRWEAVERKRLAQLARDYGLKTVIRWQPRNIERLETSGLDVALTMSLYAIIGAVALEKGGGVANKVVRDRILAPLGL